MDGTLALHLKYGEMPIVSIVADFSSISPLKHLQENNVDAVGNKAGLVE